jgi:hypothetical protein
MISAQAGKSFCVSRSDRPQEFAGLFLLLFQIQDCLLRVPGPHDRRKRVNKAESSKGAGGRGPFRGQDASCTRQEKVYQIGGYHLVTEKKVSQTRRNLRVTEPMLAYMKRIQLKTILTLTLAAAGMPLHAADTVEAQWNQVCRVSEGRELLLTTATGEQVRGFCFSVDVDHLGVRAKSGQVTRIARTTLAHIEMASSKGRRLHSLGTAMHDGLKFGVKALFSPMAPVGLVTIPGTLAWGAVAAPFCVLGDLGEPGSDRQEIKVI